MSNRACIRTAFLAAAMGLTAIATPGAQLAQDSPTFEVASVKRNLGGEGFIRIGIQPGGRYTATNVTLRELIRQAYQLQPFQLVGAPDWVGTDRFDIIAKAEHDIPPTPMGTVGPIQLMVRALLADRFKLVVHEEEREMPIYALVLARDDKRLGPALKESTVDCQALMKAARNAGAAPAPPPGERPMCGVRMGAGRITAGAFPMSQFPSVLAPMVQRYVIDRTGLTGNYEFELTYTPDQMRAGGGTAANAQAPGAAPAAVDPGGASIFTALQEQLGLKLDSQRGPVKVMVVDSVQPPTED